jgi:hypothetical protein
MLLTIKKLKPTQVKEFEYYPFDIMDDNIEMYPNVTYIENTTEHQ